MNKKEVLDKIRDFIAKGRTEDAIETLVQFTKETDSPMQDHAILLSGQFKQWKKQKMMGIQQTDSDLRRIEMSIMDILQEKRKTVEVKAAPSAPAPISNSTPAPQVSSPMVASSSDSGSSKLVPILIGAIAILVIGFIGMFMLGGSEEDGNQTAEATAVPKTEDPETTETPTTTPAETTNTETTNTEGTTEEANIPVKFEESDIDNLKVMVNPDGIVGNDDDFAVMVHPVNFPTSGIKWSKKPGDIAQLQNLNKADATKDFSGLPNTLGIIQANSTGADGNLDEGKLGGFAAGMCVKYSLEKDEDWYLPAYGEMVEILKQIRKDDQNNGTDNLLLYFPAVNPGRYWTSTELDASTAFSVLPAMVPIASPKDWANPVGKNSLGYCKCVRRVQ